MFFTTSGSTCQIGSARPNWSPRQLVAADFATEAWTLVEGVNSLGRIAGEWGVEEFNTPNPNNPADPQISTVIKAARPSLAMQITAGVIEGDNGQRMMVAAENAVDTYAFQIVLPDSQPRLFIALVTAADHVFDEANAVVCWSFTLKLQSNVYRGA